MSLHKRLLVLEKRTSHEPIEPVFIAVCPADGITPPVEATGVHLIWDKSLRIDRLPSEPMPDFEARARVELIARYCDERKYKPAVLFYEYPPDSF